MPRQDPLTPDALLQAMRVLTSQGQETVSSSQLAQATAASLPTVKRMLTRLVAELRLEATGKARSTRYRIVGGTGTRRVMGQAAALPTAPPKSGTQEPIWTGASQQLRQRLSLPLAARTPVTYRRDFVDNYKPNQSSLLPPKLAEELALLGRLPEQMPAATYARKVLEQLRIDLSWSSSHLEGNRYTLLDTEKLFKSGAAATDSDAVMLLNHKAAIEFLVDAVPTYGLGVGLVRNLHAVLMQDLLMDTASLGAIREKVVHISGTTYVPTQVPALLQDMLDRIVTLAQYIKNPVESAFFLWINLAYLQPFEDGNKRVSRLCANVPLMLYNQAPLSFLDIDRTDYAMAMMGVYELCDVSMAVDLFEWSYRRSQARYKVVLESMGSPDPFRIRNREALNEAVGLVVRGRRPLTETITALDLRDEDSLKFRQLLAQELDALAIFNCARYRLSIKETQAWIDDGRPR